MPIVTDFYVDIVTSYARGINNAPGTAVAKTSTYVFQSFLQAPGLRVVQDRLVDALKDHPYLELVSTGKQLVEVLCVVKSCVPSSELDTVVPSWYVRHLVLEAVREEHDKRSTFLRSA